jgi:anti-sigma regulatory factor (Ser/Thr protein kinase)
MAMLDSCRDLHANPGVHRCYAAVPDSVSHARYDIARVAAQAGASQEELERISLAASEAVTNVVEHAYPHPGGEIEVFAALAGDDFALLVSDRGAGFRRDHRSEGLGMGLALMCTACDSVTFAARSGGGMEVRMRVAIAAPRPRRSAPHERGSLASASIAAPPRFSTTT